MWLKGKTYLLAISLALVVLALHDVQADDIQDQVMDAIKKASANLPGGMNFKVMGGDDFEKKMATDSDDDDDDDDDDEPMKKDAEGDVQEIKIDNIEEGGQTFTFGADGTVTETKGTAEASEEEDEEEIDESKIGMAIENEVLKLDKYNFRYVTKKEAKTKSVLVMFYNSSCGHCKNLAPEYERAAKRLKELKNPVYLAKVDATEEGELASKYDVNGYPTLKWFRDGQAYDYDGPREEEGIVEYMKQRASPDWKPPPVAVVTLTTENFTDFINGNDLSLVEFYAPWCGHCKKLAPEYEKAAQKLKEMDPPIPLAKVDATAESSLGQEYGVTGYPTMKIFRRGTAYEYRGERNEYGIVSYMQGQTGDPSKEKTSLKDLQKAFEKDDVTVVGFFNEEDVLFKTYLEAANDVRDDYTFLHTFDAATRDHFKVNGNSVVVFQAERFHTKYESKRSVLEVKLETKAEEIRTFFTENNKPLVGEYASPAKRYTERPLALFFYTVDFSFDGRTATQLWRNKIAAIANDFKDQLTFAIADEDKNKDLFKDFGFEDSGEEINVGILGDKDRKYPMEPEEFDADEIKAFLKKFVAGKVKPIIKSAPAPKKQGVVKTVVGNTFEKIVMDPKKDVLIELYAPWCGHCKNLEPKYKELAKKLKGEKNLVIAKMDATANDAPPEYSHTGFPTIYFAPAGDKLNPVKFEGGREIEDFEKFLKEQATVSFGGAGAKEEL